MEALVKTVINSEDFKLPSPVALTCRESAASLVEYMQNKHDEVDKFVCSLATELKKSLDFSLTSKHQRQRERMWGTYHSIRTSKSFISLWHIFLTNANITPFQPFYQHITDLFFHKLIQHHFSIPSLQSAMTEMKASSQAEYQEANAVRYVGGYVCHTIKHQLQSRPDSNFNQEILLALWELIEDLEVESESELEEAVLPGSSKDWTSVINRGGLITINDEAYEVFSAIEAVIKTHYKIHNVKNITDGVKSTLLKTV